MCVLLCDGVCMHTCATAVHSKVTGAHPAVEEGDAAHTRQPGLHVPDEGVVKGRDEDPAWVLRQFLGQLESLVQHLQGHRGGRSR